MSSEYEVSRAPHVDVPTVEVLSLHSPDDVVIGFAPGGGMVGCSLTHAGEQLLGMRGGLAAYLQSGKTFGIPLLAPWANRLEASEYDGVALVTQGTPGVHPDANGLPIHGLLAGCPDWKVTRFEALADQAVLAATLTFDDSRPEFPAFPFPHELSIEVTLKHARVTITTGITPISQTPVPIAFGWHPYFAPPGGDRQDWTVSKPFTHHVLLDERCVPTGDVERVPVEVDVLGDPTAGGHVYDDLFCEVPPGTKCWVEGGRHRITLTYISGYPYAVLFAPADQALVAIEPMTAPTDPLAGHFPIRFATQDKPFAAMYSIDVTSSGESA